MVEQLITEIFTQSDVRSALSQLRKVLKDAPEKRALCAEEEQDQKEYSSFTGGFGGYNARSYEGKGSKIFVGRI